MDTNSEAEERLFERLQAELPNEWVVFHSVGLAKHESKPWAEVDFVLVGPRGVLCLEVKGGRVERRGGEWHYGSQGRSREGPFEQAKTASFALRRWLLDADSDLGHVLFGWGVVLPDVELRTKGPDIERSVLVDATRFSNPMHAEVEAVFGHWEAFFERKHFIRALTPALVNRIAKLLRGDFEAEISPRAHVRRVDAQQLELTDRQRAVMAGLSANPRVWVRGPAGTGKTVLAFEEAASLVREGNPTLLLCYNRRLADHLAHQAKREELQGLEVRTIHSLAASLGAPATSQDEAAFEAMLERAIEAALEGESTYGAVVVDEGQDLLRESHLDLIDCLLGGGVRNGTWRWFSDPNQNVFDRTTEPAVARLESAAPSVFTLTVNCRNTIPIAELTGGLTGIDVAARNGADGPAPEVHSITARADAEVRAVVRRLLDMGLAPDQVKVLIGPDAWGLVGGGDVGHGKRLRVRRPSDDPVSDDEVEACGIGAFKGLEAEAVVLLVPGDVRGDVERRMATYVGASRARTLLHVFADEAVAEVGS